MIELNKLWYYSFYKYVLCLFYVKKYTRVNVWGIEKQLVCNNLFLLVHSYQKIEERSENEILNRSVKRS